MTPTTARNALVLGTVTATAPFAIDMYLPAFAAIARDLHTDQGTVQLSVVSFFVALACGQPLYGPISDEIGRRKPLLFGLILFVLASLGCAFAPNIEALILLRFVQGIGGCAGIVIVRAVIRDLHTGEEAARLFALTLLVLGLSPVFAPLIGSLIVQTASWRFIFAVIALIGAASTLLVALMLKETRPVSERHGGGVHAAVRVYSGLLRDASFVSAVLTGGFAQAILFAYVAGSSFVFISIFGTSPFLFSLIFAINAVALIGSAQFTAPLIRRFGAPRLIGAAITCLAIAAVVLLIATLAGLGGLWTTAVLVFVALGCFGFAMPPATMLALEPHGRVAGTASALMGTVQFAMGAFAGFLISAFFDGTARPLFVTMAFSAVASFLCWQVFLSISRQRAFV